MNQLTLAFDTATEECAIALGMVEPGVVGVIAERDLDAPRASLTRLLPTVAVSKPLSAAAAWATADEPPKILAGNGLRKHGDVFREALGPGATFAAEGLWTPTGRGLLRAYADDLAAGRVGDGDAGAVLPVYTRLSDAEETERDRANATADASAAQGSVPDSGVAGPEGGAL
jgi:hypothetical protein